MSVGHGVSAVRSDDLGRPGGKEPSGGHLPKAHRGEAVGQAVPSGGGAAGSRAGDVRRGFGNQLNPRALSCIARSGEDEGRAGEAGPDGEEAGSGAVTCLRADSSSLQAQAVKPCPGPGSIHSHTFVQGLRGGSGKWLGAGWAVSKGRAWGIRQPHRARPRSELRPADAQAGAAASRRKWPGLLAVAFPSAGLVWEGGGSSGALAGLAERLAVGYSEVPGA
jgi:hypothetical protein